VAESAKEAYQTNWLQSITNRLHSQIFDESNSKASLEKQNMVTPD
jgi:hypothetical protein